MSFSRGPNISTNGLVFCMDYANEKSYPGYGSTVKSLMTVQGSSGLPSGTINSLSDTSGDQFITQGGGGINRTSASDPTRTRFSNIATTSHLSFFTGSFSLEAVFSPSGFADNTYRGLVDIFPKAKNAQNFTQCDSLLMGNKCGAHTIPYIKNKNSDSNIAHEATTSKISEDQLFYCQQRGLDSEEAVSLIVNGFCKEVLQQLPMEFAVEAQKLVGISLEGSVG